MKRTTGAIAMAGITALLLTACGGDTESDDPSSTTPAAEDGAEEPAGDDAETTDDGDAAGETEGDAAGETAGAPAASDGTSLVIWADDLRAAAIQPLTETFTADTGVEVKVQIVAQDKLREQFKDAVGQGAGPDITIGAHDWLGELVQNNVVAPVQIAPDVAEQFVPESIEAVTFEGQLYAVPYSVESLALIRNTDLAPEAPASMEELVANGEALVEAGDTELILAQELGKEGNAYSMYPYLSAYGGGIFPLLDEGGFDGSEAILDSPETLKGAEKLGWLGEVGALSTNQDASNVIPNFVDGKAAYMVSGPWAIEQITTGGINYAIDPIPDFEDGGATAPFLGVQAFYVSAESLNPQIAQTFVQEYVPTEEIQVGMFEADRRPPALSAAAEQVQSADPDIEAWAAAAEGGVPMPNIPQMNAVWGPLGKATADIVDGDDPAERMGTAQTEVAGTLTSK
ncbi:extracellular solute-binding protein [Ornithinimicrobium ciconiae]|uniref:Extracellular solute-binding protein n=1 Tax=Ornithinimicrobium ciconiae TaxID=2594265 RepID=A0A516G843_9MICO|nr:extracellular solute-binding protein [Ornithinimicrobium ciconiae]QDO87665.1 extracellular solute-binding protein [Ornithinimicrobium ciconiae]